MEIDNLIGTDVQRTPDGKSGIVTIFGKGRNYFKFFGSNLATPAVPDTRNQLTTFSLEAPKYLRQGVVALSYYEINDKGDVRANPKGFLHVWHNGTGQIHCELKKTFVPAIDRLAHVEDDGIVAMVGNQLVASFKKPGALLADADKLCTWVMGEISDEQLLASVAERAQEKAFIEILAEMTAEKTALHEEYEASIRHIAKLNVDLYNAKEIVNQLTEEKGKISEDAQKLQISLMAIFRRFNEYKKLNFISKLITPDTIEKKVKEELEKNFPMP